MEPRAKFENIRPEELIGKFRSKEDLYKYLTERGKQ
jgi:hypothetical protein